VRVLQVKRPNQPTVSKYWRKRRYKTKDNAEEKKAYNTKYSKKN